MAQPPSTPKFDKSKYPAAVVGAFQGFWDLLYQYFERITAALRAGITVSENMSAGWVDVKVGTGSPFPITGIQNPIPDGSPPHGVLLAQVRHPVDPNRTVDANGVTVRWTTDRDGSIVILGVSGLNEEQEYLLRLLVFAQ